MPRTIVKMQVTDVERRPQRRWLWIMPLLSMLTFAVLGYAVSSARADTYVAKARVFLGPGGYTLSTAGNNPAQRVNTLSQLAVSELVLGAVARDVGVDVAVLRDAVAASAVDGADIIDLEAEAPSADAAVTIAEAVVTRFAEITTAPNPAVSGDSASRAQTAVAYTSLTRPESPSAPLPARDALLAALLGLVVSAGALQAMAMRERFLAGRTTESLDSSSGTVTGPADNTGTAVRTADHAVSDRAAEQPTTRSSKVL